MRTNRTQGFSLIELMAVVAIIAVLTALGVGIYKRASLTQYDAEAISTLNNFYVQISRKINDWGLSTTNGSVGLTPGCEVIDMRTGQIPAPVTGMDYQLHADTSTANHWVYQICIGYLNADQVSEAFILSAHRIDSDNNQRIILMSSSLQDPVLGASDILPPAILLHNVTWDSNPIPES